MVSVARRNIGSIIWIAYLGFWVLMILIIPRFLPQYSGYGFFLPFFLFFPFFRRRGRGNRPRPVDAPTPNGAGESRDSNDFNFENMLSEEYQRPRYQFRNYTFYVIGIAIIVVGIILIYGKVL